MTTALNVANTATSIYQYCVLLLFSKSFWQSLCHCLHVDLPVPSTEEQQVYHILCLSVCLFVIVFIAFSFQLLCHCWLNGGYGFSR